MSPNSWTVVLIFIIIIVAFVIFWVVIFPWINTSNSQVGANPGSANTTGWGGHCQLDSDCAGDLLCSNDTCRQPVGGPCYVLDNCAQPSNYCNHVGGQEIGRCTQLDSGVCGVNDECPEGTTASRDQWGNCLCLGNGGTICQRGQQCKSGRCEAGYCEPPRRLGQDCQQGQCTTGLYCSLQICQFEDKQSGTVGAYCNNNSQCNIPNECIENRCRQVNTGLGLLQKCTTRHDQCMSPWSCLNGYCRLAQKPILVDTKGVFTNQFNNAELTQLEDWPRQLQTLQIKRWAGKYILTNEGLYFDQQLIWAKDITDIAWDNATSQLWVLRQGQLYIMYNIYGQSIEWRLQEWNGPAIIEFDVYRNQIVGRTGDGEIIQPELHLNKHRCIGHGQQPRWITSSSVGFISDDGLAQTANRIIGPKWFNDLGQYYTDSRVVKLISNPDLGEVLLLIRLKDSRWWLGFERQQIFDTLPWEFNSYPALNLTSLGVLIANYGFWYR